MFVFIYDKCHYLQCIVYFHLECVDFHIYIYLEQSFVVDHFNHRNVYFIPMSVWSHLIFYTLCQLLLLIRNLLPALA